MTDLHSHLAQLRRPRLLIRAARFGLAEYRRTPALRRLFAQTGVRTAEQIVGLLLRREADMDDRRRAGDPAYGVAAHVETLIALMAESRLLPRPVESPEAEAGGDAATRVITAPAMAATDKTGRGPRRRVAEGAAQPKASGISALRLATKSSSAARTPSSSAGAW